MSICRIRRVHLLALALLLLFASVGHAAAVKAGQLIELQADHHLILRMALAARRGDASAFERLHSTQQKMQQAMQSLAAEPAPDLEIVRLQKSWAELDLQLNDWQKSKSATLSAINAQRSIENLSIALGLDDAAQALEKLGEQGGEQSKLLTQMYYIGMISGLSQRLINRSRTVISVQSLEATTALDTMRRDYEFCIRMLESLIVGSEDQPKVDASVTPHLQEALASLEGLKLSVQAIVDTSVELQLADETLDEIQFSASKFERALLGVATEVLK